jgi:hypothetical protein
MLSHHSKIPPDSNHTNWMKFVRRPVQLSDSSATFHDGPKHLFTLSYFTPADGAHIARSPDGTVSISNVSRRTRRISSKFFGHSCQFATLGAPVSFVNRTDSDRIVTSPRSGRIQTRTRHTRHASSNTTLDCPKNGPKYSPPRLADSSPSMRLDSEILNTIGRSVPDPTEARTR